MNSSPSSSLEDQLNLIEKLLVFEIQGRDKHGHKILRIIGKFFPARLVSSDALNKYLEDRVFPNLDDEKPFSMVYIHTDVNRTENFPGISTLRSIYEAIPAKVKDNLESVYFVHPGIQSRLFLATFGRFLFSGGLYQKLNYVIRLEFLWDYMKRSEIEVPEFVCEHDEELEYRPMMDYGIESDHPTAITMVDSPISMYSMRCIA
ncbi:uncharacterized protein LOC133803260 [Humulus lupulus]|uniref:uncharacterized protein LOC133803260 n=1 Tax=Humulus lupulus TaxID=3486 RepID=UPI002B403FEF|nr:uncharacterized protein LOC133803260 [Humulus lupulus]